MLIGAYVESTSWVKTTGSCSMRWSVRVRRESRGLLKDRTASVPLAYDDSVGRSSRLSAIETSCEAFFEQLGYRHVLFLDVIIIMLKT